MKKVFSLIVSLIVVFSAFSFIGCGEKKSAVFNENEIVLSFSAMSDIHQQKGKTDIKEKLVKALGYAETLNGKPLDLALFAGDLTEEAWRQTNVGKQTDYTTTYNADIDMLKTAWTEALDLDKTGVFYTLGNHDTDPSKLGEEVMGTLPALFKNQLGNEFFRIDTDDSAPELGRRHAVVNGYHFLAVQPDYYWTGYGYSSEMLDWIDGKLKTITKESPEKYVFVTAHPPLYETVFGACTPTWSDSSLKKVLEKYPQVIYFSGHIHNVLQDEIQLSQDGYITAADCGSVKYTDWMNNVNENLTRFDNDCGTRVNDFSQGLLVQVDKSGNVKITRCDYYKESVIKEPWLLSYPKADGSHLKAYDNQSRRDNNKAPEFADGTTLNVSYDNGTFNLDWNCATDDDQVRYYLVNLYMKDGTSSVKIKTFYLATFTYRYDKVSDMPTHFEWSFTEQSVKEYCETHKVEYSGDISFELRAVDVWYAPSKSIFAAYKAA